MKVIEKEYHFKELENEVEIANEIVEKDLLFCSLVEMIGLSAAVETFRYGSAHAEFIYKHKSKQLEGVLISQFQS